MTAAPGYQFRRTAFDHATGDPWRALDRAVARWVLAHGGSNLLAEVAAWASLAEGHGDSALPLAGVGSGRHGMRMLSVDEITALRDDGLVGSPDRNGIDTPFALDAADDGSVRFYLRRNFLHEMAVAARVAERRAASTPMTDSIDADIDALFHAEAGAHLQPQRDAVARVLGRRLFVLTGGPGTGKTTTVLRMLLMLIKQRATHSTQAPVIRISAPTGKAAQRLTESLRDGAARLREHALQPLPASWHALLDTALAAQSSTLHRLLGSRGRNGGFVHHAGNPLPADIVVVDEASMVDLTLLRALLDALHADTVLIVVGDADQLTSVGTGSVLLDLVGAMEAADAPDVVRLRHSFRADQSLVPINEAIRAGDRVAFDAAWHEAGSRVRRVDVSTRRALGRVLHDWRNALHASLVAAGALEPVPRTQMDRILGVLDALRERQLLCALREGDFGAQAINAVLERSLSAQLGAAGDTWYAGRAVMITRNDYTAGLFNGDVGVCLRDDEGHLRVWFEVTVRDGDASSDVAQAPSRRAIDFDPSTLPEHQGAFAVTIHKSQGSEYSHVAVLLPPEADNRILSRQLLYTGVSRAKQGVELWATDAALDVAIATPVRRAGGMAGRFARTMF